MILVKKLLAVIGVAVVLVGCSNNDYGGPLVKGNQRRSARFMS